MLSLVVCLLRGITEADFLCPVSALYVSSVCSVLFVFGCQYQCSQLPGKTRPEMIYYVSSVNLNSVHSSLTAIQCCQ